MMPFTRLAVVVLWLSALPQLLRFIAGWEITLNGAPVPLWLSVLVAVLAASLAVMVWREQPRQKSKTAARGADTPSGQWPG
jgi:sterol desaturase/sphingolipid hydroxylase (fatty acid hydroxylase superfamily)